MLIQAQEHLFNRLEEHSGVLLRVDEFTTAILENICLKPAQDWSPSDFARASDYLFITRALSENLCSEFNQLSRMSNCRPAPSLKYISTGIRNR